MPKQETADLQLLGQVQAQLQMESDSMGRAEQQKTYLQSMIAQTAPVVDIDPSDRLPGAGADNGSNNASNGPLAPGAGKSRSCAVEEEIYRRSSGCSEAEETD